MHISFDSTKLNSIVDKHYDNLELLESGKKRIDQLSLVGDLYKEFLDNGFIDLISYIGCREFFKVLKERSLLASSESKGDFPYDFLSFLVNEFSLPEEIIILMIYNVSKNSNSRDVFDYSLLTNEILEIMESIMLDHPNYLNSFNLLVQSYLIDIRKDLYSQTSIFLRDVYSEIVFFKKLYQTLNAVANLDSMIQDRHIFNVDHVPVLNILSFYRNKYIEFSREFKKEKVIIFR